MSLDFGPLKIGIALYAQTDDCGHPTSPYWALVAHPSSYLASDVQTFRISRPPSPLPWHTARGPTAVCQLADARNIIGVLHVGEMHTIPAALAAFVEEIESKRHAADPSGYMVWDSSGWVTHVLRRLILRGVRFGLPCWLDQLYEYVMERMKALKEIPKTAQEPLPVLPLSVRFSPSCSVPTAELPIAQQGSLSASV